MVDFNSQIGQRNIVEPLIVEKFNYCPRNDRGWKLDRFCQQLNLKTMDMDFTKSRNQKSNRLHPLSSREQFKENFKFYSYHRLLVCKLTCKLRDI